MSNESYEIPIGGWTCYFCGETFTTPGSASDHFGAEGQAPGCLVDYRIQVEQGGKPERGRGLLIALRREQEKNEKLRRELEEEENNLANVQIALSSLKRKIGSLIRPGRTVERLIELFHATDPAHGGLVLYCNIWPCSWIQWHHQYTRSEEENVEPALRDNCIICTQLEDHEIHVR